MPKVNITYEDSFRAYLIGRMKILKLNQKAMAKALNLGSRQVFSYKMQHMNFTFDEYRKMFLTLQTTPDELARYFL